MLSQVEFMARTPRAPFRALFHVISRGNQKQTTNAWHATLFCIATQIPASKDPKRYVAEQLANEKDWETGI